MHIRDFLVQSKQRFPPDSQNDAFVNNDQKNTYLRERKRKVIKSVSNSFLIPDFVVHEGYVFR